jgi:hypothetical protein
LRLDGADSQQAQLRKRGRHPGAIPRLTGGAVYAASKIHSRNIAKNAVKSRNIAKNGVKARNLAAGSVSSSKIHDGTILPADFAPGAGASVLGSFDGGSAPAISGGYPLNPQGSFSTAPGETALVVAEGQGSVAWDGTGSTCFMNIAFTVDGNPGGSLPYSNPTTNLQTSHSNTLVDVVTSAGNHLVTAQRFAISCTGGSTVDFVHVRVLGVG